MTKNKPLNKEDNKNTPFVSNKKKGISCFVKDEYSNSVPFDSPSNYTLIGIKKEVEAGTIEKGIAFKVTDKKYGGFVEYKGTSTEFANNIFLESRTRVSLEKPYNGEDSSLSLNQRFAFKGAWKINNKWNFSETAGVNLDYDLKGEGLRNIGPTSVTSIGYKATPNTSIYIDSTVSKQFDVINQSWKKPTGSITIGVRYNFNLSF